MNTLSRRISTALAVAILVVGCAADRLHRQGLADVERGDYESGVTKLGDASLSYSGLGGWADRGRLDNFLGLTRSVWRSRAFGDFWSHMLVAEGAVDVSAEPEVSLWDLAALQVIVEEAGGRFTSLAGDATPDGGSVVCTNGHLHDEVLALLAETQKLPSAGR